MVNNLLIQNNQPVKNQVKSLINLPLLEDEVKKHPMIAQAEVSLSVEGKMKVSVEQRKPLARVFDESGDVFYLDEQGARMPLSKRYAARVLLVDNREGNMSYKELFPLIERIYKDEFLSKTITTVSKKDNDIVLNSRFNNQKVALGDLINIKQKLKKLKVYYAFAEKDIVAKTFKKINLKYHNQIVCSK